MKTFKLFWLIPLLACFLMLGTAHGQCKNGKCSLQQPATFAPPQYAPAVGASVQPNPGDCGCGSCALAQTAAVQTVAVTRYEWQLVQVGRHYEWRRFKITEHVAVAPQAITAPPPQPMPTGVRSPPANVVGAPACPNGQCPLAKPAVAKKDLPF